MLPYDIPPLSLQNQVKKSGSDPIEGEDVSSFLPSSAAGPDPAERSWLWALSAPPQLPHFAHQHLLLPKAAVPSAIPSSPGISTSVSKTLLQSWKPGHKNFTAGMFQGGL